jgi:predicted AAA+ superfamily ATPase
MIHRRLAKILNDSLSRSPAVVLLGPRQVGKTTLALEIARALGGTYLDLESERDRAKLAQPELYLDDHQDELLVLDEIHRVPSLLPLLRGAIDRARQRGKRSGLYLLLGSASLDLLKQSGETLAGRVSYFELGPFDILELDTTEFSSDVLWVRGGLPDSLLAADDAASMRWRRDFIRSYLERDIPQFGPRIAAETLRRFWTMLAHQQAGMLNAANLARGLGVSGKTAASYLDLLVDLLLVRRLQPFHKNVGKRLVKSPKVFIRDSGIVHALLDIPDKDSLLGHPVVGPSYEGFVVETLLACAPREVQGYFYRTSGGAEIDLLLVWSDDKKWAIEIKRSLTPAVRRGFHSGCADLQPTRKLVVYPGKENFRIAPDIEAVPLASLARDLAEN